jgi:hypothetical protein
MSIFGAPVFNGQSSLSVSSLVSASFNTAIGDLLVCGWASIDATGNPATMADTAGNSFASTTMQNDTVGSNSYGQWFYCFATHAKSNNVMTLSMHATATLSYAGFYNISLSGSAAFDVSTLINYSATSPESSAAFNIAGADELVIAMAYNANGVAFTHGTGYTADSSAGSLFQDRVLYEHALLTGPASGKTAGVTGGGGSGNVMAIAFKAVTGVIAAAKSVSVLVAGC